MKYFIYLAILICFCIEKTAAQVSNNRPLILNSDSTSLRKNPAFDSASTSPKFNPAKATLRSAILPGWGQAYTKRYLMIPIVYTALGVPAGFFIYNNTWYKRARFAYELKVDLDSLRFPEIHLVLRDLSPESLRFYRNDFRRNRDYSVLFFILAWGLNVVDATVFAHLKEFDVSDDLSMKIKPTFDLKSTGVSFVIAPRNTTKHRVLTSR